MLVGPVLGSLKYYVMYGAKWKLKSGIMTSKARILTANMMQWGLWRRY